MTPDPSTDHMDHLCQRWAAWATTRRYYGPPPLQAGILGKLTTKTRAFKTGGPDAECAAELPALHLAIQAQERDTARTVFELHYLRPPRSIKAAAAALGISRSHWYTLLADFRRRAYAAHLSILADNLAAASALPHRSTLTAEPIEG
jgi:hypothetical protein